MNFPSRYRAALLLVCLLVGHTQFSTAFAQGTAFTYQGRLNDGSAPANGAYDFRFRLATDPLANNYIGGSFLTNDVPVESGLFTVALDFGTGVFTGSNLWLEIAVRTNGGSAYATLSPLQALTPTPYALYAENAGGSSLAGTYTNPVTLNNSANNFIGNFTGNGASLSNVNALTLNGLAAGSFWQLGGNNVAAGQFLGSTNNQPVEIWANGTRALRFEPNTNGAPNVIGGAPVNYVDPGIVGATIAGGGTVTGNFYLGAGSNHVAAIFGTIAGGRMNTISADHGFIGGGISNTVQLFAYDAVIGGGVGNLIATNSYDSVIAGGFFNSILGNLSFATIAGGQGNTIGASDSYATIGGGSANAIQPRAGQTTIGGGANNLIQSGSDYAVIGGGYGASIGTNAAFSLIGGGENNQIQANSGSSTIAGGILNMIQSNAPYSTIGGGSGNSIQVGANSSLIAGGANNVVQSNAYFSFVGSGLHNVVQTNSSYSTIVGGQDNTFEPGSGVGFIGGGAFNRVQSGDSFATIAGGASNTIRSNANSCFIGGGQFNAVETNANMAVIGGGYGNLCAKNYSTVPGGFGNSALGEYSFAAGKNALATGNRSFVWNGFANTNYAVGDSEFFVFATNGFSVDYNAQTAGGGGSRWVYIGNGRTGSIINPIYTTIAAWNGAYLSDGGTWTSSSDRARKENLAPVDSRTVLERVASLPIQTWNYTNEPTSMRHLGPTAQDFHAAFGLNGQDDKHITDIDEGGVALAAIQGLNQKLMAELKRRDAENAELKHRLELLERTVSLQAGTAH